MNRILFLLIALVPFMAFSQEKKEELKFGITFSGFVKTDVFYDSRQTINSREGHFLLYPDNVLNDFNLKDINAKSNFNMLSIQSRLKGAITGPDAFGAKTSGVLEADFFGNASAGLDDVNGFRLRHAFIKLNWKTTELLIGQYWHPMFIAESFPAVISFNTGAPFQPFSRNPQIRLAKSFGGLKMIGCLYSQRDFASTGVDGVSSKYMRNSGIPDAHFQFQYKSDSSKFIAGAGVDYKTITPELFTINPSNTKKFASDKTLSSLSAIAFANVKLKKVSIKLEGVYAQNAYDMTMIGGYAVKQILDSTGAKEFTNLNTGSIWTDIQTAEFQMAGKKMQFGLFAGYTKLIGSNDSINGAIYARNSNIDHVYRIAPRIIFISGKVNFAIEGEYTYAMYGTANGNKKGLVTNVKGVANTRLLMACIYNF